MANEADYRNALEYIHGFYKFGSVLGLDRITRLLELLGNPQRQFRCIHVAGTNGKGSVAAMAASILGQAGYKVGRYISPYIQDFGERISVDGRPIPHDDVPRILSRVKPCVDRMIDEGFPSPTEFEVVTAMGFLYFAERQVDVAAVEVGLGGRFDATNVIENPLCSAITRISLDHTDRLGGSLAEIAREKAGIIKPGAVTVSSPQEAEALRVIERTAIGRDNVFWLVGRDVRWREREASDEGQVIDLEGVAGDHRELYIPLLGQHQQENAATAVAAVMAADGLGMRVSSEAVRGGLSRTRWPGRLEVVGRKPLVIIDGAHNADGARRLAHALKTVFSYDKLFVVIGVLGDKAVDEMLSEIMPLAHRVFTSRPDNPRAMDPDELAKRASLYCPRCQAVPDVVEAVDRALALAREQDAVLVTGSLYMIGKARSHLVQE